MMVSDKLRDAIRGVDVDAADALDPGAVDRVLTEPQQDSLAEAIAADAVDATPLVGDILALARMENAEEQGIEYPERPAAIENAFADLPPPLDTAVDVLVAQNVMSYLQQEKGLPISNLGEGVTEATQEAVETAVPDFGDSQNGA